MATAGAADRNGQIAFTFDLVSRQQDNEHRGEAIKERPEARIGGNIFANRRILTGHRAELFIVVWIGKEPYIEHQIGFAWQLPREADLVFDVRFLSNPHYDEKLRPMTGEDAAVGEYVSADACFGAFLDSLTAMLVILLPRYEVEGKSYLTIAVGCTGGRHRSVYTARRLVEWLENQGRQVHLHHRDIAGAGGRNML